VAITYSYFDEKHWFDEIVFSKDSFVTFTKKEGLMSYVESSNYESETAVQAAQRKIAELHKALNLAQAELKKAEAPVRNFGDEFWNNGTVLKFDKQYNGVGSTIYTFAAIKADEMWFITSSPQFRKGPFTTQQLKDFIGNNRCWVMFTSREIQRLPLNPR
jgi:hypothetical protein